jgi:hypothetical protein
VIYTSLNAEKALIWRIVHCDNLGLILDYGLHCANSDRLPSGYLSIGNPELIDKRRQRVVPVSPGMMKNIHSGRGVTQRRNEEILILVSSLHHVKSLGLPFLFTNAHAYPHWSNYYSDLAHLAEIDWGILQRRDFKRDPDDPGKMERYQAEALIFHHLPIQGILGIVCYTELLKREIEQQIRSRGLELPVYTRKKWYFS